MEKKRAFLCCLSDHVDMFSSLLDPHLLVGGQMFRAQMHNTFNFHLAADTDHNQTITR